MGGRLSYTRDGGLASPEGSVARLLLSIVHVMPFGAVCLWNVKQLV